ncbi:MAG: DUF2804 domain-containing protein [Actinomycetota bacterium]
MSGPTLTPWPADPTPVSLRGPDQRLRWGRFIGPLVDDPLLLGPRGGRARRWAYVAAGDEQAVLGAAMARLGPLVVAFAFASIEGRIISWDGRARASGAVRVGRVPAAGARWQTRGCRLHLDGRGGLELDLPTEAGRLVARIVVRREVVPVVLTTPTPGGGWNATEKAAGSQAGLTVALGDEPARVRDDACGWRDWTSGRQDRRTDWRWVAGAGWSHHGVRVGLNASRGMNATGVGEDVVWLDGRPHALQVDRLGPVGSDGSGPWRLAGPGSTLDLTPSGVRARRERLGPLLSDYTQPIGSWAGTLTPVGGGPVRVALAGVAEDHRAAW